MKIIGKTDYGYILEASKDDIALIMGFRNAADGGFKTESLRIGTEINIDKIDKVSRFIRNLDQTKLTMIKGQLQTAINGIDDAMNTTSNITLFNTLGDEE